MPVFFASGENLGDVADAIREKLVSTQSLEFPGGFVSAIQDIPSGGITPTGTINITQNGTTDVTQYASANVAVPNSYAAADEGKVVSSGALVAQTSSSTTINGTFDTTLINSFLVNVSGGITPTGTKQISITQNGTTTEDVTNYASAEITVNVSGGGSGLVYETGTWTPDSDVTRGEISFANAHTEPPFLLLLSDVTSDGNPTNAIFNFGYFDPWRAFGGTYPGNNSGTYYCGVWYYSRTTANPSYGGVGFGANSDTASDGNASYPRYWVSTDKFHPGMSNNTTRYFYASRTYKWYAVWKPST